MNLPEIMHARYLTVAHAFIFAERERTERSNFVGRIVSELRKVNPFITGRSLPVVVKSLNRFESSSNFYMHTVVPIF